jgi:hypothetical protein
LKQRTAASDGGNPLFQRPNRDPQNAPAHPRSRRSLKNKRPFPKNLQNPLMRGFSAATPICEKNRICRLIKRVNKTEFSPFDEKSAKNWVFILKNTCIGR